MTQRSQLSFSALTNQQAAIALLTAAVAFLRRNNMSENSILEAFRQTKDRRNLNGRVRQYRRSVDAYEDMGVIMSTWHSLPKFLDQDNHPVPLTTNRGANSISNLVRSSRVNISAKLATELMRRSPSVGTDPSGNLIALKRVFVLPEFEVSRAALVIERYLNTLRKNSSAHRNGTTLLLERNCHVPEIDLPSIAHVLRDIKSRGSAFMDSIDGDIEARRVTKARQRAVGELGVLVFAWTRPRRTRKKIAP